VIWVGRAVRARTHSNDRREGGGVPRMRISFGLRQTTDDDNKRGREEESR